MTEEYVSKLELDTKQYLSALKNASNQTKTYAKQMKQNTKIDYRGLNAKDLAKAMSLNTGNAYYVKELNDEEEKHAKVNKVSFKDAIKNITKYGTALIGIRSVWSLLYRGVNEYMQENKQLQYSLKLTSSLMGNMLSPAIKFVVNSIEYALIFIDRLIVAFGGVSSIGATINNAMKNIAKSTKKANSALASFDTITNLADNSDAFEDIANQTSALEDFKKKVADVEKIFKNYTPLIKGATIALGILFGANMLSKIGNIIGVSKVSGLLGISGILTAIAIMGTIYVAVEATKKTIQFFNELKENKKNMQELIELQDLLDKNKKEINNTYKEKLENGELDNEQIKIHTQLTLDSLNTQNASIKASVDQLKLMGDGIIVGSKYRENMLRQIESQEKNITALEEWMDVQKLSESEYETYIGYLKTYKTNLEAGREQLKKWGRDTSTVDGYIKGINEKINEFNKKKMETKTFEMHVKDNADEVEKNYHNAFTKIANSIPTVLMEVGSWFTGENFSLKKELKKIWSYDVGTNYIPNDQLAMVHKGEMIVPKKYNPMTSGIGGTNEETNGLLRELITTLENKDMNAYLDGNKITDKVVSNINSQSRIMGRSIIR